MTACAECRNGFWRAGSVWLTCSPNGADFPSGTVEGTRTVERGGLYFRYSTNPQSYTHLLLAFVVLLSGLLLIRALTWCPPPPHRHPPTPNPLTHPPPPTDGMGLIG